MSAPTIQVDFGKPVQGGRLTTTPNCHACPREGHLLLARLCRDCGARLPPWQTDG